MRYCGQITFLSASRVCTCYSNQSLTPFFKFNYPVPYIGSRYTANWHNHHYSADICSFLHYIKRYFHVIYIHDCHLCYACGPRSTNVTTSWPMYLCIFVLCSGKTMISNPWVRISYKYQVWKLNISTAQSPSAIGAITFFLSIINWF